MVDTAAAILAPPQTEPLATPAPPLRRVAEPFAVQRQVEAWRAEGLRVAFVPTMGALHEGHLSLVRRGLEVADRVVASVFVNPTQFGPGEDFERYPRDFEGDAAKLAGAGCSLLYLPSVEAIYPPGASTFVEVEGPSRGFEGAERPGHFRGVATVVTALFQQVRPDVAIFGQKDAQQLAVVRKLVRDLHLGIEIVGAPIVREPDGLAMSSRNVYLDSDQRRSAAALSRSLVAARRRIEAGERDAETVANIVRHQLETETAGLGVVDYVAIVDTDDFEPVDRLAGSLVIAIAVRFGATRLLDNLHLDVSQSSTTQAS